MSGRHPKRKNFFQGPHLSACLRAARRQACNAQAGQDGLMELLKRYFAAGLRRLRKLWVDGGYRGDALKAWVSSLKQTHKIDLEVVQRESKGFEVMKWRWVVERTFA